MARSKLPSADVLRQLIEYFPETGHLTWLWRGIDFFPDKKGQVWWNTRFAGKDVALNLSRNGYHTIKIFRSRHQVHRVIWTLVHGAPPKGQIDHINGTRTDNRLSNLRDVDPTENQRNMKRSSRNKSGVTGVCAQGRRWVAYISIGGRQAQLGCFPTLAEAVNVRKKAEVSEGYHKNHGRIINQ